MRMQPIVLRGGRVLDPSSGHDDIADVVIEEGRIRAVGIGGGLGTWSIVKTSV